jgi:hypothetical protein
VIVRGTCRENVVVRNVEALTFRARPGATLLPAKVGPATAALEVVASRSVRIEGLTIHGGDATRAISLRSCEDCVVSRCTIDGGTNWGIAVDQNSSASVSATTLGAASAGVLVVGSSTVHIDGCTFDRGDGGGWAGLAVAQNGFAVVKNSVFRNFLYGIAVLEGA